MEPPFGPAHLVLACETAAPLASAPDRELSPAAALRSPKAVGYGSWPPHRGDSSLEQPGDGDSGLVGRGTAVFPVVPSVEAFCGTLAIGRVLSMQIVESDPLTSFLLAVAENRGRSKVGMSGLLGSEQGTNC
uniref:Uncharacterized protein n=1 Tax=Tetraselmis sp. GSL018 TaxID=582737 RepID=A0A061R9B4_9CHLO